MKTSTNKNGATSALALRVVRLFRAILREWKRSRMRIEAVALSERRTHHVLMAKIDGEWVEGQSRSDGESAMILIDRDLLFNRRYPKPNVEVRDTALTPPRKGGAARVRCSTWFSPNYL